MRFLFTSSPATFLARPNRYTVVAQLRESGAVVAAHCPNPGRLGELLVPGTTVHLSVATPNQAKPALRKTAYDLRFVEHPDHGQLISLDTRLPNQLFAEGLRQGYFPQFAGYVHIAQEVPLPYLTTLAQGTSPAVAAGVHSRIDFQLHDGAGQACWIEVKSASLVIDGCARFPDAVTERGRRHLLALAQLAEQGERSTVVFIVQRPDAHVLRPQWSSDPAFAQALVTAQAAGVELYAYTCTISLTTAQVAQAIPVRVEDG